MPNIVVATNRKLVRENTRLAREIEKLKEKSQAGKNGGTNGSKANVVARRERRPAADIEIGELLTINEATKFLRTSRATVYALMTHAGLEYYRVGAGRRISKADLARFVARSRVAAKGA